MSAARHDFELGATLGLLLGAKGCYVPQLKGNTMFTLDRCLTDQLNTVE